MNYLPTPTVEDKLQAVIGGARAILDMDTFEDAARSIFDLCCNLTGATSGYVALLSDDGEENEVLFLEGGGAECTVDPELPMPIRGLRADAYHSHRPTWDNDFMHSDWVKFMPAGHMALRNVLFAPLNIDGKTMGIIGIANKPADFTEADAEIVAVLGDLAAIALRKSRDRDLLEQKTEDLTRALEQVHTLHGLLPMCPSCKNIRNDEGFWTRVDSYLTDHTDAQFTHCLCPDCLRKLYPDQAEEIIAEIEAEQSSR